MRLRRQLFLASLATFILLHIVLRPLLLQVPDAITNSKHAADAPPQTLQIISSTSPPPPPPRTTSYASCARIRSDRLLVYAAHSGFGNQELSLRRALLVSYVLNRTLVLPPILKQSDLAFGPPEEGRSYAGRNAALLRGYLGMPLPVQGPESRVHRDV